MHYDFDKDLVDGHEGEAIVQRWLGRFGATQTFANDTKTLDTLMHFPTSTVFGMGHVSFEIKTDVLVTPERDTGNLFIEVQSRGKKSGIQVCRADWFVYFFKHLDELWMIQPENLLALIRTGRFRSVYGGDEGSGTRGVLIDKATTSGHFLIYRGIGT